MSTTFDQEQVDLYTAAGAEDQYELVSGVFVLPLAVAAAAGQAPVAVVQAHAPYRVRTVTFATGKSGNPPALPKPVSEGAFTFVGGTLAFPAPTGNLNGGFDWKAAGEYVFVSGVYNSDDDGYILSALPFAYSSQVADQGAAQSAGGGAPEDVQQAGIGPKVGWVRGQQVVLTNPNYSYSEPTYYPGVFFSESLTNGANSYPSLG